VLHDLFAVPFDDIATIVGRSPDAARQLASRARRRVRGGSETSAADLSRRREVVDAFLTALRAGDFEGLLAVLDPDLVVRADFGDGKRSESRGAAAWAKGAASYGHMARVVQPALVNGDVGLVMVAGGRLSRALTFKLANGRIVEIEIIGDAKRVSELEVSTMV
jgi:ketosteroid isomerase-like protein